MIKVIFDKGGNVTEKSFPAGTCWQDNVDGIEVRDGSGEKSVLLAYFPHGRIILVEKIDSDP